jgi:hypothetical protein
VRDQGVCVVGFIGQDAGGVAVVIALVAIGGGSCSRTSEGASGRGASPSQVAVNPPAPALEPPETEDLGVVPDVAVPATAAGAAPAPDSARVARLRSGRPIAPNTAAIPVTPPASLRPRFGTSGGGACGNAHLGTRAGGVCRDAARAGPISGTLDAGDRRAVGECARQRLA